MSAARVIIVGGGASGVLMAAHLLRLSEHRVHVTIVERRNEIGCGLAYSTRERTHLLNTRAASMSAFDEDPNHFWRWLVSSGIAAASGYDDPFCFVPRACYREYLHDLVRPWLADVGDGRLSVLSDTCTDLVETKGGVAVTLKSGRTEMAQLAILATGHAVPLPDPPYAHAWCSPEDLGIHPDEDVLILGTGLSMVDNVSALVRAGHRGRITALSRRAQLPRVHRPATPMRMDLADIPLGTEPSFFLRWLRRTVRWAQTQGLDWRDVMDALRPHNQRIWEALSPAGQARFLRHGRTLWDVHRHRMAPEVHAMLEDVQGRGLLRLVAGRLMHDEREGDRRVLSIRRRDGGQERLHVDRIIDCTGVVRRPDADAVGLMAQLLSSGLVRTDRLGVGIDVSPHCAVIGRNSAPSRRVFALGPVTKARFWEITAVPDIRLQCQQLASHIAAGLSTH